MEKFLRLLIRLSLSAPTSLTNDCDLATSDDLSILLILSWLVKYIIFFRRSQNTIFKASVLYPQLVKPHSYLSKYQKSNLIDWLHLNRALEHAVEM